MSEWKKVKIGEFLTESKVLAEESDAAHRITVRLNCKGVEKRGLKAEKEGATKYYTRYTGQFIYGKQNIHKGAFGIIPSELDGFTSSADLPAFDIDESKCVPEWIPLCLKVDERYKTLQKEVKGVGSQRLAVNVFLNVEIPLPEVSVQRKILAKVGKKITSIALLDDEIEKQKSYAKQLRQSILQDAIEGKLTEDWRKKHPLKKGDPDYDAEALFEKIQTEKQEKGKKQKPLHIITEAEKPFAIPFGWKWVRLGEVCDGFMYGTSAKSSNEGKCPVLRMGNIQNGKIDWEKLVFTNNNEEIQKYELKKFDLLFNRTNSREMVGKTAIFESEQKTIYAGYLVRFRSILSNPYFINDVLNSKMHREWCNEVKVDALGQSNINAEKLKNFITPLPPLAEQKEIVVRVEQHLQTITQLETQIATCETTTKQLMQSILKDAFGED